MNEKQIKENQIIKVLLSVGIGGIANAFFIEKCKLKLLPFSLTLQQYIESGSLQNVNNDLLEICILIISIFSLLVAPLLGRNNNAGVKIFILIILLCIDTAGIIVVMARTEIFTGFVIVLWLSSCYGVWLGIEVLQKIYCWLQTDDKDRQFDVAKMTLIWAVIAFILGRVW